MIPPERLRDVDSLLVLSREERAALANRLVELNYPPGSPIVREGQRSPGLFLLLEGQVVVSMRMLGQRRRELSTPIPVGEWFGMISVIDELPATASVIAVDEVRVAAMSRKDFSALLASSDPLGCHFFRALQRCLADQLDRVNQVVVDLKDEAEQRARTEG